MNFDRFALWHRCPVCTKRIPARRTQIHAASHQMATEARRSLDELRHRRATTFTDQTLALQIRINNRLTGDNANLRRQLAAANSGPARFITITSTDDNYFVNGMAYAIDLEARTFLNFAGTVDDVELHVARLNRNEATG